MKRISRAAGRGALAMTAALALVVTIASAARADAPQRIEVLDAAPALVSGGPGHQSLPKVSGDLLVYSDVSFAESVIRYVDLAAGTSGTVPSVEGARDTMPDVSGTTIVFRRSFFDGTAPRRAIMVFDTSRPEAGVRELAPTPDARRWLPAIGGTTVAFTEHTSSLINYGDVCVADLTDAAAPAVCLTSDGATMQNDYVAVSPDGNTVVWHKCAGSESGGCDIYLARRGGEGTWGAPERLTDDSYENYDPATDGSIVTYSAVESPIVGEQDAVVRWISLADGSRGELDLSALDMPFGAYPSVSRGVITFQAGPVGSDDTDLYAYRPATGVLYRVTQTPAVFEWLSAVSVSSDGVLRITWAQEDGLDDSRSNDVHAVSAQLPPSSGPVYEACRLYDAGKAYRLGSTVPLRVRLCDSDGVDLSSPERTLTATGLVKLDGTASPALADSSGNANPDSAFRYDVELEGYVYNLSTKGLSPGTWELRFTVDGSSARLALPFDVR